MRSITNKSHHIPGCRMQLADWPRRDIFPSNPVSYGLHVPHLLLSHVVECSDEPSMTRASLPVIKSDCLFSQLSSALAKSPISCNDPLQFSPSALDSFPKTLSSTCPEGLLFIDNT
ncbi:hypothetical protein SCLCIDRAFT_368477 [Scleroderma citrinum Foug A]|uniref:Uncharacterized protein n=1 Tax=Scleroderma citrinum Foug A TaxID=1036808 RepID=A0A0C3EEK5_9AGAM|nr:hypothetical protein SCLCIDRAFT_368477 [Scleroderma citrinum Foug A]